MEERFTYDHLNRLTGIWLGNNRTGWMDYDAYGRMAGKTIDNIVVFANAEYDATAKPHAIDYADVDAGSFSEQAVTYTCFDKAFQLKNTYLINKVIYESQNPYIHENFNFYSSNSNSTFVIPDGDDVLVATYYEKYEIDTTYTNLEFGVAAARYNLRTMQRKALVKFNDYSGLEAPAKCYGFQKMPDGTVYLLYREEGMPVKYWMTVVKMDSDLNVEWKRYCETPEKLMYVDPFGTQLSITVEDGEGNENGFVCSETYQEGVIHLILTHDGIPASVVGGIEVRPYAFYPNPVKEQLLMQFSPDVQPKQIELYDLQGRLVHTQSKAFESIDMSQLPAGTYTMRVTLEDGKAYSDKVVKE